MQFKDEVVGCVLDRGNLFQDDLTLQVVDAFLYLGPRDLRLFEPTPAAIALDTEYMTELQRREALTAFPGTPPWSLEVMRDEILQEALHPILEGPPPPPDVKAIEECCRAQRT
jgi:hypothetical protein